MKVGLVYGSDTEMTEEITHSIIEKCDFWQIDVQEVSSIESFCFEKFDFVILGLSTG